MSWVLDVLVHVIKALWLTVWGTLRALLSIVPLRGQRKPELSSELCLVTGAGQGLGRQLALQMADCGASLVLWDIDEEKVSISPSNFLLDNQAKILPIPPENRHIPLFCAYL